MKSPRRPFVEYDGRCYLVVNFDLEPTADTPPLPTLLHELLRRHPPGEVLLLRLLTSAESRELHGFMKDAEIEAWAHLVVADEDRLRGRTRE